MKIAKIEFIFLSVCLVAGAFLRLYRLPETAMFLGDQGRDAIIAKNIIKAGDIALIGPVTSVGNMYLGPFYYYFMTIPLAITYPNPIGPVIAVALLGTITIPLVYFVTKKMFSWQSAVFATLLFTFSSVAIDQVRFSWNPNLAPTFGLLIFYLVFRLVTQKKYTDIIWLSALYSVLIQLHYMALLVGVFIGASIAYSFFKNKKDRMTIIKQSLIGLLIFGISLVPLILFDIRHDHLILNGFSRFFSSTEEHVLPAGRIVKILTNISGNVYKLLPGMLGSTLQVTHQAITLVIVGLLLYAAKKETKMAKTALAISVGWFAVAAIIMSLYSSSIFTHYISFSQAVSIVFIGALMGTLFKYAVPILKGVVVIALIGFIVTNPGKSTAFLEGKSNIDVARTVSQSINQRVNQEEKYDIVLISGTGDIEGQSYRYFLETSKHPPVEKTDRGNINTLFIIQEDYFDQKVTDSPIYEIVVFPKKNPHEVYTIPGGPTITVLKRDL